jgi:hypothetical protein
MRKILFVLIGLMILSACFPRSFRTLTFPDPAYLGKQYSKFCMAAFISDDAFLRKQYEVCFAKEFTDEGLIAESSLKLFPPTREWSDEQIHEKLNYDDYDAYLLITTRDGYTETEYIPAQKTVETKNVTESKQDDSTGKSTKEIYTQETVIKETPALINEYYYVIVEIKLIDVKTSETAWVSYIKSHTGKGLLYESFITKNKAEQIARSTLEDLITDGFINIPKK